MEGSKQRWQRSWRGLRARNEGSLWWWGTLRLALVQTYATLFTSAPMNAHTNGDTPRRAMRLSLLGGHVAHGVTLVF